jgi:hypothetical protein
LYQPPSQSSHLPPSFRFPPLREGNRAAHPFGSPCGQGEPCYTNRAGKVHKLLRVQNPPTPCPLLIRVQRFGKESLRQGRFFPAHARGQARSFALTPCVPISRRRERGNALQGAPPCAPTPLSHAVGEGLRVRAKKRARPAHSELKRCTLISPLSRGDRVGVRGIRSLRIYGLWRCSWYNISGGQRG